MSLSIGTGGPQGVQQTSLS